MPAGIFADLKESRSQTLVSQSLEHVLGAARPGTIVERQNDFLVAEKIPVLLEMLDTELRPPSRIDLDDAG
jgi:hypothetical protein